MNYQELDSPTSRGKENMVTKAKGIPEGASVLIPRLVCRDPVAAIAFCASTFGAVERVRRPGPDGTVVHALMTIGPAMLMIEARQLAGRLASNAPIAMRYIMSAINEGLEMPFADACVYEATLFGLVASTEDMREGTRAFLEKRKAEFRGR